jgi:hypothetical protein
MFIGQTASVSSFNGLHLGEGFLAGVGYSKNLLSKEDLQIVLRQQILIKAKKPLRSTDYPYCSTPQQATYLFSKCIAVVVVLCCLKLFSYLLVGA